MKKSQKIILPAFAMMIIVAGCSAKQFNSNGQCGNTAPVAGIKYLDNWAKDNLQVDSVKDDITGTGSVRVFAVVKNCSNAALHVQLRTQFFEENASMPEPASAWRRLIIQPNSMAQYQETSMTIGKKLSYIVEMREGN